ncbi:hypothetical protein JCM8097_003563 [Rhodosporidiobolus ruineniae]
MPAASRSRRKAPVTASASPPPAPPSAPSSAPTAEQASSTSTSSPKRRRRPVEPSFDTEAKESKKRRVEPESEARPANGRKKIGGGGGAERGGEGGGGGEEDRRRRIGEKYSPGSGQLDYVLTAPLPARDSRTREFIFDDFPEFTPNLSPEEIVRGGAFDGGFFRPVKSKKSGRELHEDWRDFPREWYDGLDVSMYLTRPELTSPAEIATSVNKWQAKMGQGYEEWEKAGWIVPEHDARGWFQWYARFFLGRRCADDARQVLRWARCAGEQSGRWRRILLDKYRKRGVGFVEPEEESVSRGIRQTLRHWAYDPTTDHLNRFREEKGDKVTNDDADEAEAGEG